MHQPLASVSSTRHIRDLFAAHRCLRNLNSLFKNTYIFFAIHLILKISQSVNMSSPTEPQDRTAKSPSPTDSEKAQESYDEFLRIFSELQTVLLKAIKESQIEEQKKIFLCADIDTIITKANGKIGTGTAFKSMDEKKRQELINWLLAAYNHSAEAANKVLEETTEKLRTEEAHLKKKLERNTEEWKRTQAAVKEKRKRTIESHAPVSGFRRLIGSVKGGCWLEISGKDEDKDSSR